MSRRVIMYFALRNVIPESANAYDIAEELRKEVAKALHVDHRAVYVWNILDTDKREFIK